MFAVDQCYFVAGLAWKMVGQNQFIIGWTSHVVREICEKQ